MIKSVSKILKRCPVLYNIAGKAYDNLPIGRLKGTQAQEEYWAKRHLKKDSDWNYEHGIPQDDQWVAGYWESRHHPHRPMLIQKLCQYQPFNGLLEIGCNCGPNLYLLARAMPEVKMQGIDINPRAIQKGKELLAAAEINNVNLTIGRADELTEFADKSFDIVFTDAVMIYIGPDKIEKVIREMLRLSRLALIFLEQHDPAAGTKGQYRHGKWIRDYTGLMKQFIPEKNIRLTRLTAEQWPDRDWQTMGTIIEARLPLDTDLHPENKTGLSKQ